MEKLISLTNFLVTNFSDKIKGDFITFSLSKLRSIIFSFLVVFLDIAFTKEMVEEEEILCPCAACCNDS